MNNESINAAMFLIFETSKNTNKIHYCVYNATFETIKSYTKLCYPEVPPMLPTAVAALNLSLQYLDNYISYDWIIETLVTTAKMELSLENKKDLKKNAQSIQLHMISKLGFTNMDHIMKAHYIAKDIAEKYKLPSLFLRETSFWATSMLIIISSNYNFSVKDIYLTAAATVLGKYIPVNEIIKNENHISLYQEIMSIFNVRYKSLHEDLKEKLKKIYFCHTGIGKFNGELKIILKEHKCEKRKSENKSKFINNLSLKPLKLKHGERKIAKESRNVKEYLKSEIKK